MTPERGLGTIQPGPWRGAGPSDNPKVIGVLGPVRDGPHGSGCTPGWPALRDLTLGPPGPLANLRASAGLYVLSSPAPAPALSWGTVLAMRQTLCDRASHATDSLCRALLVLPQPAASATFKSITHITLLAHVESSVAPAGLGRIPESFPCPTRPGCLPGPHLLARANEHPAPGLLFLNFFLTPGPLHSCTLCPGG